MKTKKICEIVLLISSVIMTVIIPIFVFTGVDAFTSYRMLFVMVPFGEVFSWIGRPFSFDSLVGLCLFISVVLAAATVVWTLLKLFGKSVDKSSLNVVLIGFSLFTVVINTAAIASGLTPTEFFIAYFAMQIVNLAILCFSFMLTLRRHQRRRTEAF